MKRLTLEECQKLALERGGKCLSQEYINNSTKMLWECSKGHQWKAKFSHILYRKQWCPYCCGNIKGLEDLQKLAETKNAELISDKYINRKTHYLWKCKNNKDHLWLSTIDTFKRCQGCIYCYGNKQKTIEDCKILAQKYNGQFLSNECKNTQQKYLWKCINGHEFLTSYNTVRNGHWCPFCNHPHSKPELEILHFVKNMFPDADHAGRGILGNNKFQLDVYIPSLKKAIEFDGYYHKFPRQIQFDSIKNQLCKEMGIGLLRIPWLSYKLDKNTCFNNICLFLECAH
jgi:hypothetical protein